MKKCLFALLITYFYALHLHAQGTVLSAGDISIVACQADDPDLFGFVTFVPLVAGTTIYFTDCGATSATGTFNSPCTEGARKFVAANAVAAGEMIFYVTSDPQFTAYSEAGVIGTNFLISTGGDQMIAFQDTDGTDGTPPASNPNFIFAVSTASTQWAGNPSDNNESSLPNGLINGTTALAVGLGAGADTEYDNAIFNTSGMPFASIAAAKAAINNVNNWYGAQIIEPTYSGYLNTLMNQSLLLPVELLSFDAILRKNMVELSWVTATEINNQGFEIQQSGNGKSWKIINFVEGNGNTEIIQHYDYQHKSPTIGTNYYRLKQIDYDGVFEYSKIQVVNWNKENHTINEIHIFPNPAHDLMTISLQKEIEVIGEFRYKIFNQTGQLIQQKVIQMEAKNFVLDVQSLVRGLYILEISQGNTVYSTKFLKE